MCILQKYKMDPRYMNRGVSPRSCPKEFTIMEDITAQFCQKTNNQIAVIQSHHAKSANS